MSSATVGRVYHEQFLHHYTGSSHPERPDRLRAVSYGEERPADPQQREKNGRGELVPAGEAGSP